ncbi:MAG: 50S ribosomal protein L3 [Patescibacteria group bacterium]|jgi:large subunit ribosomal protein L3
MKYIIGTKLEMTQAFRPDGSAVAVTLISAEPCTVARLGKDDSGHSVAIIGVGKTKHPAKAQAKEAFAHMQSLRLKDGQTLEVGAVLSVNDFTVGDKITVIGTSKGKGFQGVVKRHGFHGHPTTHGHKDQVRKSGSIGAGGVQRVFKGMRMAGRMGGDRVTVQNLEVITIDTEKNILGVMGAVPGARGGSITIHETDGNVWHK